MLALSPTDDTKDVNAMPALTHFAFTSLGNSNPSALTAMRGRG